MYIPIRAHISTTDAQAMSKLLQRLEHPMTPGAKPAIERYQQAAGHALLVQTVRETLGELERGSLAQNQHDLALFHLVGVLALEGSEASMQVVAASVEDTLASMAPSAAHETPPREQIAQLVVLCHCRRVLRAAPAVTTELRERVRVAYETLFARTLMASLLEAAGVDTPGDGDWSFSLTHLGEGGWAQVTGSSDGDVLATFGEATVRRVLVEDGLLLAPDSLPPLDDIRSLRQHFERCAEAKGFPRWSWGQPYDTGPHGSTVKMHGLPPRARKALEAWWLGGQPIARIAKKETPPSRFEASIPAGTTEAARKSLHAAFRVFDTAANAASWPTKRIRELAKNPVLVRTLASWIDATPDRDEGFFIALAVLSIDGSADALAVIERLVTEVIASGPDTRALWTYLGILREYRPADPLVAVLGDAWSRAFAPSPGGRLLRSMGVSPPTDAEWQVVLMARQDSVNHVYLGDCIIEIYPHGFFRAEAHVAGPRKEALGIRERPEAIEAIREHFAACAVEAKLAPWSFAAVWDPEKTPNGAVVQVRGFSNADRRTITSWFRNWKPG